MESQFEGALGMFPPPQNFLGLSKKERKENYQRKYTRKYQEKVAASRLRSIALQSID